MLRAGRPAPPWLYPLLLALPFLVGIAALEGLTVEIETFHGSDARVYHLPTILQFADRLDFERYPAAQTPLYHVLFAFYGEVAGFELWRLRLLNVAISYGAVLVLFRLLVRRTGLEPAQAFALSLLFALSPYFFGASFTLLTDNLALLFGLLALERLDSFRDHGSLGAFALGVPRAIGRSAHPPVVRVAGPRGRGLPAAGLAAADAQGGWDRAPGPGAGAAGRSRGWPGADLCRRVPTLSRAACAPTGQGSGATRSPSAPSAFSVGLFGLYAAALYAPILYRRRGEWRSLAAVLAPPVLAGAVLVALVPLLYKPIVPGRAGDAGYLWKLSDRLPEVLGSSLLFWALVPLGALSLYLLVARAGPFSLPSVYLAAFLVAALPVGLVYQKYFDPFALLALALFVRPPDLSTRHDYAGIALLAAGFVAYALNTAL